MATKNLINIQIWEYIEHLKGRMPDFLEAYVAPISISLFTLVFFVARRILSSRIQEIIRWILPEGGEKIYTKKLKETGLFDASMHLLRYIYIYIVIQILRIDNRYLAMPLPRAALQGQSIYGLWFNSAPEIIDSCLYIYFMGIMGSLLTALADLSLSLYEQRAVARKLSLSLFVHITKLLTWIAVFAIILSGIMHLPPAAFFNRVAAAAALLIYIFKEYIIGVVYSIQLTLQDLVRVGDWITVPKYKADGTVEKITVTVLKIRNFDKTIIVVPTYALFFEGFQNWQAMKRSGGRRIKRSIPINQASINLLNQEALAKLSKVDALKSFVSAHKKEFALSAVSNLTLFRAYVNFYLKHHTKIQQSGFTFLVRQLEPTAQGLPLQIYVFTNTTQWTSYEDIQSAILEHLYATMPYFGLNIYQRSYGSA